MNARQLDLFADSSRNGNGGGFRDPAFSENKTVPIHRWVPWIAGYSAQFIDDVLTTYGPLVKRTSKPLCVLDPFAGVGTTLVQSMIKGCITRGFEINPFAALAARMKVNSAWLDVAKLDSAIRAYQQRASSFSRDDLDPSALPPRGFKSRIPFFSPRIEKKVLLSLGFIDQICDADIRDVFRVAFGSVMVSFSNYSYEPSLGTRAAAGKQTVDDADVPAIILDKLRHIRSDIVWIQNEFDGSLPAWDHVIYNEDFLANAEGRLGENAVDLMITSPPYMNNYHYVRNSRPHMYWLSLVADRNDTRHLEEINFGKFWQTVRCAPEVALDFRTDSLVAKIDELRHIRSEKGAYGGPGWANYVATYVNDSLRFLRMLYRVLRPAGIGVIVVGNSIIQGVEFDVDGILAEMASANGYRVEKILKLRDKRVGASITQSSVRRGKLNGGVLYESAVVIQKRPSSRLKARRHVQ
jgi:hypothetical protein